jgi:hypothetical protein
MLPDAKRRKGIVQAKLAAQRALTAKAILKAHPRAFDGLLYLPGEPAPPVPDAEQPLFGQLNDHDQPGQTLRYQDPLPVDILDVPGDVNERNDFSCLLSVTANVGAVIEYDEVTDTSNKTVRKYWYVLELNTLTDGQLKYTCIPFGDVENQLPLQANQ